MISMGAMALASLEDNMKAMVRIFRRECHRVLESERTTIRGSDEMLMALQLTMAEVNKQESGEFGVALSDVLLCWKCLLLDRLQLPGDGSPRPESYDVIRQEYESFLKRTNTLDLIDVYSLCKQLRLQTDSEDMPTPTQLLQLISGTECRTEETSPIPPCPSTPSSQPRPCTAQMQRVARRVFCSYLGLLVNSKNDLSLANALDTPCRSLGRSAFTDIKHAAQKSQTSLFLAVTSFVRAIQLGGKGYAPSESDPLRKHVKGLTEFVHFTDQLEEILGETPDPSVAGAKLVARIRAALLKGRSSGDPVYTAVDKTAKKLKECISHIHSSHQQSALTMGISPARPKAYAINHATAYIGRDTVKVLMNLLDEEALAPPCRNKAELLTEDQSVLGEGEGASLLTLYKSPEVVTGTSPQPLRNRIETAQPKGKVKERGLRSQFACTYKEDDDLPLNRVLDFPSTSQLPTCKHPAPKRLLDCPALILDQEEESTTSKESHGLAIPRNVNRKPPAVASQRVNSVSIAALGSRQGNAKVAKDTQKTTMKKKSDSLDAPVLGGKSIKRKQADMVDVSVEDNQPPSKKPPPKAPSTAPTGGKKGTKASTKKQIAGQGKLTSFFRL